MDEKQYLEILNQQGEIAYTADKAYLLDLQSKSYQLLPFKNYRTEKFDCQKEKSFSYTNNIRALQVKKWVFDKEQSIGDCFKNVLSLFALGNDTIALVVKRKQTSTEMYFVIQNPDSGSGGTMRSKIELLENSLKGNFPGTKTEVMCSIPGVQKTEKLFRYDETVRSVAVMVNSPSKYSEEYLTQGIDKLLNGIVPKNESEEYTVIFLAESLSYGAIAEIISGYEELADKIFPYSNFQYQHGENHTDSSSDSESSTDSEGTSKAINRTHSVNAHIGFMGIGGGYGYSWGTSRAEYSNKAKTLGRTKGTTDGTSDTVTLNYKSYTTSNILKKLEQTMERIDKGRANGLWKFSTYILAKESSVSKNVANYIRSLTQGKESFIEPSVIQEWSKKDNEHTAFDDIYEYIQYFTHPAFMTKDRNNIRIDVTSTSYVATDELSHVIAFPQNSMQGLPVLKGVQFGREPHLADNTDENSLNLGIGHAYHMYEEIEQNITLSSERLTEHTFITGSTGAGKSNTTCQILHQLQKNSDVKFLVIEPAKGEYAEAFPDAAVYDVNLKNKTTNLLRLNPFYFPEEIHILHHLDRLVEIFNVCWPMYAAMPAILKKAMHNAYESCGWDMLKSENKYHYRIFPDFSDVLREIRKVVEESDYSADNKSDYTGSLVTRVESLTTGIFGVVFKSDGIPDEKLFDENVIADLSSIGSTETKSLIMGILVLKLQEYRMNQRSRGENQANTGLNHVTVLEEAHHLLKRTSTEQNSESSNLLGKSVEMLTNSIAEMRTYGEGFIIADQSPGLLDMAVIRNTNTKIIHRLPEYSDRELVGKAVALNEKQIEELARLEKGVAVIRQSDWLEPVLCKVEKYDNPESEEKENSETEASLDCKETLLCFIVEGIESSEYENEILKAEILHSELSGLAKKDYLLLIEHSTPETWEKQVQCLLYDMFDETEKLLNWLTQYEITEEQVPDFVLKYILKEYLYGYEETEQNIAVHMICSEFERRRNLFL